mgnify:CR=1 FL=1
MTETVVQNSFIKLFCSTDPDDYTFMVNFFFAHFNGMNVESVDFKLVLIDELTGLNDDTTDLQGEIASLT